MGHCSLFLLLFACLLTGAATTAASKLSFLSQLAHNEGLNFPEQNFSEVSSIQPRNEIKSRVVIFRRTPTKSSSPQAGTSRAITRSQSQPNLGISSGGVRPKNSRSSRRGRRSTSPDRLSEGSQITESSIRAATIRTASTRRYESRPALGTPLRALAASSSSGRSSIRTSPLSHTSQDSLLGVGSVLTRGSMGASLGSPHRSLTGFEGVLSPVRSAQSQRSIPEESIAGSSGRSNIATSPETSRSSLPSRVSLSSSAGMPSLFEAMGIRPVSSTFPTSTSIARMPAPDRNRIHDSPSSMRSMRLAPSIANPAAQNSRPARPMPIVFRPGQLQVPPESPASRIGSLGVEANSSQDGHSDRGSDTEYLESRLGRLRFGY